MLQTIAQELDIQELTSHFAEAIASQSGEAVEKAAEAIFEDYGRRLIRRSRQLGEEYLDQTYEMLKKVIDKTSVMYFPLVPQRFIEIAYLGTQPISTLPIVQNNGQKLAYKLTKCGTFDAIKEKCGPQVANSLPCRHACLAMVQTVFQDLDIQVNISLEATMPQDGYCQFTATKI